MFIAASTFNTIQKYWYYEKCYNIFFSKLNRLNTWQISVAYMAIEMMPFYYNSLESFKKIQVETIDKRILNGLIQWYRCEHKWHSKQRHFFYKNKIFFYKDILDDWKFIVNCDKWKKNYSFFVKENKYSMYIIQLK